MVSVYQADDVPAWLDRESKALLAEGRAAWRRLDLDHRVLIGAGTSTIALPWHGDHALITATLVFRSVGIEVSVEGPSLVITDRCLTDVVAAARHLLDQPEPDPVAIARHLKNTEIDKWDWVLDADLAAEAAAARLLDVPGAWRVLQRIAGELDGHVTQ
jgi:ATP-dependent Lhr-like helicase